MKIKLPQGFMTFAQAQAKKSRERIKADHSPLAYYFEETGEWAEVKVHEKDGKNVLEIYDSISPYWGISHQGVATALRNFEGEELEVRINCGGGDVFEGLGIAAALSNHKAKITARVEGICASIATVIALGCDEVEMVTGSQWMVHAALTVVYGNAREMREIADWLDTTTDGIMDVYEERTGMDRADVDAMVNADTDTFMSAQEAVDSGFVDRVISLSPKKESSDNEPETDPEDAEMKAKQLAAQAQRKRQAQALALLPLK